MRDVRATAPWWCMTVYIRMRGLHVKRAGLLQVVVRREEGEREEETQHTVDGEGKGGLSVLYLKGDVGVTAFGWGSINLVAHGSSRSLEVPSGQALGGSGEHGDVWWRGLVFKFVMCMAPLLMAACRMQDAELLVCA